MQTTRDKILDVVIGYIKQNHNLSQVSLSQIAKDADIGKSTIYEYFTNKESLITQTYQYLLEKYQMIILQEITSTTFFEAIYHQLSWILDVVEDAKIIMEVIMSGQKDMRLFDFNQCNDKIKEIQNAMQLRFGMIFNMGYQEGQIKANKKPYQENIIQALITGLMFQYTDHQIDISRGDLIELIIQEVISFINK